MESTDSFSPSVGRGVLGKFWRNSGVTLAQLWRAKKGIPKFFACAGLFFVVEALKTVKKPLKPLKNH